MYRLLLVVFATIFSVSAFAAGQTTQPSVTVEGGGVPPSSASQTAGPRPSPGAQESVLVLPIVPPQGNYGWIGRAFQDDIATDLTQMSRLRVIAPESAPAVENEQDALQQGRQSGANYVMYGQAWLAGSSIRVTGQVLEVSDGKSLASLNGAAPADNLFPLEDTVALQAAQALPGSLVTRPTNLATQPAGGAMEGPPYISEVYPARPDESTYPSTAYDYGAYPYGYDAYDYSYPGSYYYPYWDGWWWGPDIVFVPGYGWYHHHDWDHDHGWGYGHGWGYRGFHGGIYPHAGYRGGIGHGYGGIRGGFGGGRGGSGGGRGGSGGGRGGFGVGGAHGGGGEGRR